MKGKWLAVSMALGLGMSAAVATQGLTDSGSGSVASDQEQLLSDDGGGKDGAAGGAGGVGGKDGKSGQDGKGGKGGEGGAAGGKGGQGGGKGGGAGGKSGAK